MKVLIVDDSRVLRMHLRTMMQGMGWVCEEVDSGTAALERMQAGSQISLMLLDVNMPGMSGIECLRAMREMPHSDQVKAMMVTTESEAPLISVALNLGADEFLMKPFTRESLVSKLLMMGLPVSL
jgi:two-component system chemotaxis response regulator CheY